MKNFGKIAVLALFIGAAGPALAQSSSGGAMSNGSMSNGAMAKDHMATGSMLGGSMSAGAMSDHDKMAKPHKKKGAMASGSMSGSMFKGRNVNLLIGFGVGGNNGSPNTLYFADGINAEASGLFGAITRH